MYDHYFISPEGNLCKLDGLKITMVGESMPDILAQCYHCGLKALLWSVALKNSKHSFGVALCNVCLKIQEEKDNIR